MVDHKKVEQAIRLLLEGIGEDPDREGLAETPDRIARMYEEICGGMNEDAAEHLKKTFTAENNEMVRFIPCVNIICCHFTERFILPIFRMER